MKSFKEIRKEIDEENAAIENNENPVYENAEEACKDILEAIEEDIPYSENTKGVFYEKHQRNIRRSA